MFEVTFGDVDICFYIPSSALLCAEKANNLQLLTLGLWVNCEGPSHISQLSRSYMDFIDLSSQQIIEEKSSTFQAMAPSQNALALSENPQSQSAPLVGCLGSHCLSGQRASHNMSSICGSRMRKTMKGWLISRWTPSPFWSPKTNVLLIWWSK